MSVWGCAGYSILTQMRMVRAGVEERAHDSIWRWKTDKELPVRFRFGTFSVTQFFSL